MQINTKNRQQAILDILQAQPVFSQEELALLLKEAGIVTTQATLSRDLKALKISKVPGEGYVSRMHTHSTVATNLSSAIVRVQFSGQLGVIKTLPGLANAIASFIDHQEQVPVIGTIAGDDTLLMILPVGRSASEVMEALIPLFPEIQNRLVP